MSSARRIAAIWISEVAQALACDPTAVNIRAKINLLRQGRKEPSRRMFPAHNASNFRSTGPRAGVAWRQNAGRDAGATKDRSSIVSYFRIRVNGGRYRKVVRFVKSRAKGC